MRVSRSVTNLALVIPVLLAVTLGCLGPGSGGDACKGVVTFEGKTFEGTAKDEKQAGLNACNKYCLETDAEFDGMYRIWLDSPKAKEFEQKRKRKPTKEDAIMEDPRLLDQVTIKCANACVAQANKGKHSLDVKCK